MPLYLTCIIVFLGRTLDHTLGTLRTITTVKGKRFLAALVAFTEAFVWFLIIRSALNDSSGGIWLALAYGLGYGMGSIVGITISNKFIKSNVTLQVITEYENKDLIKAIRANGYGLTSITAYGRSSQDKKYMLFISTEGKHVSELKKMILEDDPHAFIVVNENKNIEGGYFNQVSK